MTTNCTRVALADDDVLVREGLASLLERSDFKVVGQCCDAAALIALARQHKPELIIADIRMPPSYSTEGLQAIRVIRNELPECAILVLSAHVVVDDAMGLLASEQCSGYLLKSHVRDVGEFIQTLRRIAQGAAVVDPTIVRELARAHVRELARDRRPPDPLDVLSPREREVLALMAEGLSNTGISHKLWVSRCAVEKHVRSILMKLQLPEDESHHRRVLAVLSYLHAQLTTSVIPGAAAMSQCGAL